MVDSVHYDLEDSIWKRECMYADQLAFLLYIDSSLTVLYAVLMECLIQPFLSTLPFLFPKLEYIMNRVDNVL
jgi:hypothetical protein